MKKLLALILALAMALSLVACGGSSSSDTTTDDTTDSDTSVAATTDTDTDSESTSDDGHTLTIQAWDAAFNIPAIQAAADDYKANVDPDFNLEIIEVSQSSDIESAVTLAASAGDYSTLPDIVLFQDHYFKQYQANFPDAWVDVNDADIDWDDFAAEKLDYSTVDGVHYGVPVDGGTVIFAYRTDLLAEVGKTVDDMTGISWDEFIEVGEEVYAATGKYLLSMDGDGNDLIYMMLQAEGESQFKDGEPYITENEVLEDVCEVIVEMVEKNVLYLANDWSDYCDQTILGDMVAGVMNGNWIIPTMEQVTENSGLWEITSLPTLEGGEGYASNGGSSLYITANCDNVELATAFLAYTFGGSTVTYDGALQNGGVVTTCISAAESDVYQQGVEYFNDTAIYAQIAEMTAKVPVVEQSDYHYSARSYLATAIVNAVNGADLDSELATAEENLRFEMGL